MCQQPGVIKEDNHLPFLILILTIDSLWFAESSLFTISSTAQNTFLAWQERRVKKERTILALSLALKDEPAPPDKDVKLFRSQALAGSVRSMMRQVAGYLKFSLEVNSRNAVANSAAWGDALGSLSVGMSPTPQRLQTDTFYACASATVGRPNEARQAEP